MYSERILTISIYLIACICNLYGQSSDKILELIQSDNLEGALSLCQQRLNNQSSDVDSLDLNNIKKLKLDIYHRKSVKAIRAGNYSSCEDICKTFKSEIEDSFGKSSIYYTRVLNTMGVLYNIQGEYKKAKSVYLEAKKLKEKKIEEDIQYAKILTNLGRVLTKLNNFSDAEKMTNHALMLKEKIKGKESKDYGVTLYNLALIHQATGQYNEGVQTIDRAVDIFGNLDLKKNLISSVQVKAGLMQDQNKIDEAISLFEEVKHERESLGQKEHSDYAKTLLSLSTLYSDIDKSEEALKYSEQANALFKKCHGEDHEYYAKGLRNYANLKMESGSLSGLENLYKQSSQIISKKYGKNHIEYFKSEFDYLKYLIHQKNGASSKNVIEKIDRVIKKHVRKASKYLSTKELGELSDLYKEYFQSILEITHLNPDDEFLSMVAMNNSLFFKGFILESLIDIRKAIKQSKEVAEISEELIGLNLKLENEYNKADKDVEKIVKLEAEIDEADVKLARSLGTIRKEDKSIEWEELQFSLSDNEAALEFVRLGNNEKPFYCAILINESLDHPVFIPLFEEQKITSVFGDKLTNSLDYVNKLYSADSRGLVGKSEKIALYDLIWQPLEEHLDGIEKIYYSCDGILHGISLEAIPIDIELSLKDKFDFLRLTNLRNLAVDEIDFKSYTNEGLVIGGIEYGAVSESSPSRSTRKGQWNFLPHSEKEADAVTTILNEAGYSVQKMKGKDAQEGTIQKSLLKENNNRILHFATHGFFDTQNLLDVKSSLQSNTTDDVMVHTGLVLSNANLSSNVEDNMLTSYEITQLNLENTELAVLSACETGLGEIYENEGVYGLQRSFKIAGAKYIIMSLWVVDDRATNEFMKTFYKKYIEEEINIVDAFNETQQEMKDRFFDADKWAGFILVN